MVNLGDGALLPVVLFAVHVDRHQLKRQSALNEDDFAVRAAGYALGIHVQRAHTQPALGQVGAGVAGFVGVGLGKGNVWIAHAPIVSGCEATLEDPTHSFTGKLQVQACRYSCQCGSCGARLPNSS